MNEKVLILTAGFGEGHNAAARALAAAFEARLGPGTAPVADGFALAAPRLNAFSRRAYLGLINRVPPAWSLVYAWMHRSRLLPRLLRSLRRQREMLANLIAREQPVAICSTYPVYAFMRESLRRDGRLTVPFFNVVTDSISINSLWWRAGAEGWFLPNEDSADVMRLAGIEERKLHVTGFPVPAVFAAEAARLAPPDLAAGAGPRVLCIVNSGTREAADTARRLLTETTWDITCTVGRNERLKRELEELAGYRAAGSRILGWTDEIPRLLMTHHVVVSKAGGATTQEAIAARCPMIVNQIVPGQEEGNYELLRRHGVGALATTPLAVVQELRLAFENNGRLWQQWRAAVTPLARPRAAEDIVSAVRQRCGPESVTEPIPIPLRPIAASA